LTHIIKQDTRLPIDIAQYGDQKYCPSMPAHSHFYL
jgi:hypothetical protein